MKPVLSWVCTQSFPVWNQFYLECAHNLRQCETSFILSMHTIFASMKPVLSRVCTQSSPTWNQFYLECAHNLLQCKTSFILSVQTSFILSVHTIFASVKPVLSWVCTQSSPVWNQFYLECANQFYLECAHNLLQCETSFILSVHTIFSSVKPVLSWVYTQFLPAWNQFYLECAHNLLQCETSFISGVSGVVLTLTVYGTLQRALQKIASWVQPKKKGGGGKREKRCTVKAKAQHLSLWSGSMLLTLSFPKCPCLQYCLCLKPSLYWRHNIAGKLFNQMTTKSNKQADGTESTHFITLPVRSWTASQHNTLCG